MINFAAQKFVVRVLANFWGSLGARLRSNANSIISSRLYQHDNKHMQITSICHGGFQTQNWFAEKTEVAGSWVGFCHWVTWQSHEAHVWCWEKVLSELPSPLNIFCRFMPSTFLFNMVWIPNTTICFMCDSLAELGFKLRSHHLSHSKQVWRDQKTNHLGQKVTLETCCKGFQSCPAGNSQVHKRFASWSVVNGPVISTGLVLTGASCFTQSVGLSDVDSFIKILLPMKKPSHCRTSRFRFFFLTWPWQCFQGYSTCAMETPRFYIFVQALEQTTSNQVGCPRNTFALSTTTTTTTTITTTTTATTTTSTTTTTTKSINHRHQTTAITTNNPPQQLQQKTELQSPQRGLPSLHDNHVGSAACPPTHTMAASIFRQEPAVKGVRGGSFRRCLMASGQSVC